MQLRPVKFNYRDWYDATKRSMLGLIAQEVESHLPETVVTGTEPAHFKSKNAEGEPIVLHEPIDDLKQIEERQLIPVLIKAVQELKEEIEILKGN